MKAGGTIPIYEYYCRTCNHTYEARRSMSEVGAPFACPGCAGETVKALSLFSAVVGGDGASLHMNAMCGIGPMGGGAAAGTCACGSGARQATL